MDPTDVNFLNALSAQKHKKLKSNPNTPFYWLVLNQNAMNALNLTIKQLHEEQLRNNPLIARLFNTNPNKRQHENSI